jgi:NAD(P)-dependent dehydrogenase (short-subunit alcohol dehydrogenase family)
LISDYSAYDTFSELGRKGADRLTQDLLDCFNTNVVGNVHLFNLFMPLIFKGQGKKVVTISSGLADEGLTVRYGLYEGAPYSVSKAAMNMASAKFQAECEKDGVLFLSLSPGSVNTGQFDDSK